VTDSTPGDGDVIGVERWVLVASILGSSMAFIDGTVVNVALPALQEALGATAAEVQCSSLLPRSPVPWRPLSSG
jgi:hypothetical protein